MQNISFGRVLKVNAPSYVADKIIDMAQRKELPADKPTNVLLGNCKDAHSYSFYDNKDESYIFTGKDGKRFWQSHCKAWDRMDYAHEYYKGDEDFVRPAVEEAWEDHEKNVEEIIDTADKILELNVEYIEDCNQVNIKSLNIMA